MNKKKIINDPLYGFIHIPNDLIYDIIEHQFFQRLRRIKQLGLTDFVYPGALHTRFHHALGAMHLMKETLDNLREKDVAISDKEYEASLLAILLHDVGHAPFSHALENVLLPGINHEEVSALIIERLNEEFDQQLSLALTIFKGEYHRRFFHQLVSSQLDIDRLDYLNRDSFFTGVTEGKIGSERIIKLIDVHKDELVFEEKGIYSIENFLSSRRLMYWQVYLHKTTVAAESMLVQILKRARSLKEEGKNLPMSDAIQVFMQNQFHIDDFRDNKDLLQQYCLLDDFDIMAAIKSWCTYDDKVLSYLCNSLLYRKLFKVRLEEKKQSKGAINKLKQELAKQFNQSKEVIDQLVIHGVSTNAAYIASGQNINIISKSGRILDVAKAADLPNIKAMSKIVKKYYLCWPKYLFL